MAIAVVAINGARAVSTTFYGVPLILAESHTIFPQLLPTFLKVEPGVIMITVF